MNFFNKYYFSDNPRYVIKKWNHYNTIKDLSPNIRYLWYNSNIFAETVVG